MLSVAYTAEDSNRTISTEEHVEIDQNLTVQLQIFFLNHLIPLSREYGVLPAGLEPATIGL